MSFRFQVSGNRGFRLRIVMETEIANLFMRQQWIWNKKYKYKNYAQHKVIKPRAFAPDRFFPVFKELSTTLDAILIRGGLINYSTI